MIFPKNIYTLYLKCYVHRYKMFFRIDVDCEDERPGTSKK